MKEKTMAVWLIRAALLYLSGLVALLWLPGWSSLCIGRGGEPDLGEPSAPVSRPKRRQVRPKPKSPPPEEDDEAHTGPATIAPTRVGSETPMVVPTPVPTPAPTLPPRPMTALEELTRRRREMREAALKAAARPPVEGVWRWHINDSQGLARLGARGADGRHQGQWQCEKPRASGSTAVEVNGNQVKADLRFRFIVFKFNGGFSGQVERRTDGVWYAHGMYNSNAPGYAFGEWWAERIGD